MDQILSCTSNIPKTTIISNSFIKDHMIGANGSYVKVYLYLSMCIQNDFNTLSISSLAHLMENTESDIIHALQYWERKSLLSLQWDSNNEYIIGIEFRNPDQNNTYHHETAPRHNIVPAAKIPETSHTEAAKIESDTIISIASPEEKTAPPKDATITSTLEQAERLSEDQEFIWVCNIVQSFLGHMLNSGERDLLIYLYDNLHFSKDLIIELYDHCCELGKTHVKYVQAVAFALDKHHITTPKEAQNYFQNYSSTNTAIVKALGLNRNLASVEREFVDCWHNEWKFDLAVILEACNRTILALGKADFKYTDSILSNWRKQGVRTLQDVQKCDELYAQTKKQTAAQDSSKGQRNTSQTKKGQFYSFQQHDMSKAELDEIEKALLAR